jgi:Cu(I)/Ag(I) efflux system membrane protein CusA/SilA
VVENLVTYPLTTTMLSVPGAKTVRGYSFFGDSFVYVLFEDKTDPLLGPVPRAGVPEPGAEPVAGRRHRLAGARRHRCGLGLRICPGRPHRPTRHWASCARCNDWFLKFELKTVPDVAEVASIGGMVRQYQVVLDPDRMRAYGITQDMVLEALQKANQETGGARWSNWRRPSTWCARAAS